MKKLYTVLLVLSVVVTQAQIINFPDANFKAKLLQPGAAWNFYTESDVNIDTNNDGEIEVSEVGLVTNLRISNANITDLNGISYFTNLKFLDCSHNALQNIVINPVIALLELDASYNQLTAVDVHYDSSGEYDYPNVDLSNNSLTTFAIVPGVYQHYDVRYNQLNSLTLAGSIDWFTASYNPLSILDLNGSYVESLDVSHTSLSSITGTGTLKYGNFQHCQFTLLDLTNVSFYWPDRGSVIFLGNNPVDKVIFGAFSPGNLTYSSANSFLELTNFLGTNYCRYHWQDEQDGNVTISDCPNLNFIGLKNGYNYGYVTCTETTSGDTWTQSTLNLTITNCPSLSYLCVDEGEQEHIQEKINAMGLQNQVQVNHYCTFVPGGTYYTVNGVAHFDSDANGCDSNDQTIPFQKFQITNGSESQIIAANNLGDYVINVGAGLHTITPIIENPEYYSVSPSTVTFNFPTDASPTDQLFCVSAANVHRDLEVELLPASDLRPGFDSNYKIVYKNKGTHPQSGTIGFAFDDMVMDLVSASPAISSQVTNMLTWNFTDLLPFETRTIVVTLNANSPTETPALNGGDVLQFTASIVSDEVDETPDDNTFTLQQTVVNSFDPNDKTCLEGATITPEMVGKYIHYLIRFENTGTANAENIVVKDMIDTTKFDVSSLIPLDGSHEFVTRINGNKVEFIFENINLPFDDTNNDGYVSFKIKTNPTLVLGDTFSNTASIYFDYNFPIVTEPAATAITALAKQDFVFDSYFRIYPNPADDVLKIESTQNIEVQSISIYNTLGQLILVVPDAKTTKVVDVSGLPAGNYFIRVQSDKGASSAKFIKI